MDIDLTPTLFYWHRDHSQLEIRRPDSIKVVCSVEKQCVWTAGFWANRDEMASELGIDPALDSTQLLMLAWERLGPKLCERIRGTLAWIIWDGPAQTIHIVRDRVGTNLVFFQVQGDHIMVAPTIEPILESLDRKPQINPNSVVCHLHLQLPFPGETFYEGIQTIEAAQHIEIGRSRIDTHVYWEPAPKPTLKLSQQEAVSTYRLLLEEVIADYLGPGKTIVTVSGGMDSTSIAAVLAKLLEPDNLLAQLWTSPELPSADESDAARSVCEFLSLRQTEIRADLHWTLSAHDAPTTKADTPFSGFFYRELWLAAFQSASDNGCSIMFTGMPGDNLFGGKVSSYADLLLTGKWYQLAKQISTELRLPGASPRTVLKQRLQAPLEWAFFPSARAHMPLPWLRRGFATFPRLDRLEAPDDPWLLPGRKRRNALLSRRYLAMFLPIANRWAARFNIDLRHPFLDHRLIEFAARLPSIHSFQGGMDKIIMRRAMENALPTPILNQREKTYPNAIFLRGFVEREQCKVRKLLKNMRAAELGWVDERTVQDYYERGRMLDHIWYVITLETWLRNHH